MSRSSRLSKVVQTETLKGTLRITRVIEATAIREVGMTVQSFRDAELEGWDRKAGYWDDSLGVVTLGAVDPLLEAANVAAGVRVLDIACGTGALVAAAARRGAEIIGMDFAPTMIAEAIRRYPGIDFRVGDAEAIPLADASVDAVTCSFGMLHMERLERVLAEIARVLRPVTGRFTHDFLDV
jgi:SAM-dependent methyltransferase